MLEFIYTCRYIYMYFYWFLTPLHTDQKQFLCNKDSEIYWDTFISWGCYRSHKFGSLKLQKCILSVVEATSPKSLSWGWNQVSVGPRALQGLWGENPSCASSSCGGCQRSLAALLPSIGLCAHVASFSPPASAFPLCSLPSAHSQGYLWLRFRHTLGGTEKFSHTLSSLI